MSLDIRVNRPPKKPAPGPSDRPLDKASLVPPVPRPTQPTPAGAEPKPPTQPSPPPAIEKKGQVGKFIWWLLLLILLAALAFLVYVIWRESNKQAELSDSQSPVVSTFTPPVQPPPEAQTEEAVEPSLAEQLSTLGERFNQLIDPEITPPAEQAAVLQNELGAWLELRQKMVVYFSSLQDQILVLAAAELTEDVQTIDQALTQVKSELGIAELALASDTNGLSVSTLAEAIRAMTAARTQLNQALDAMVVLADKLEELAAQVNENSDTEIIIADEVTTTTATSTNETDEAELSTSTATTTE